MLTPSSSERDAVQQEARSAENPKNTPSVGFLSRMKSALI